jgi:hypothetical protein
MPERGSISPQGSSLIRLGWAALVAVILIALIWPWYVYRVNAHLLGEDLEEVGDQIDRDSRRLQQQAREQLQHANALTAERALTQRLARVRVRGVTDSRQPVVIVELGGSNLREARDVICRGAERMLRRSVAGLTLRIQAHRGREPALDAGSVRCRYGND